MKSLGNQVPDCASDLYLRHRVTYVVDEHKDEIWLVLTHCDVANAPDCTSRKATGLRFQVPNQTRGGLSRYCRNVLGGLCFWLARAGGRLLGLMEHRGVWHQTLSLTTSLLLNCTQTRSLRRFAAATVNNRTMLAYVVHQIRHSRKIACSMQTRHMGDPSVGSRLVAAHRCRSLLSGWFRVDSSTGISCAKLPSCRRYFTHQVCSITLDVHISSNVMVSALFHGDGMFSISGLAQVNLGLHTTHQTFN